MIPSLETKPINPATELQDGDVLVYPSGTRIFRIGEICDDGAYGGDVCETDYPDYSLEWKWYTLAEMIDEGFRHFSNAIVAQRH